MKKVFAILIFLLLAGCGSEDISQFFYIYEKPTFPEKREKPLPYSLLVNDFSAASWLHTRQIAVVLSPNRIDYYDQYGWIAFPGELFAEQLYELFKASNIFNVVNRRTSKSGYDYFIDGYINHLELVQKEDSLYAWINMDLALIKPGVAAPVVTENIAQYISLGEDPTVQKFTATVFSVFNRNAIDFILKCEERVESK